MRGSNLPTIQYRHPAPWLLIRQVSGMSMSILESQALGAQTECGTERGSVELLSSYAPLTLWVCRSACAILSEKSGVFWEQDRPIFNVNVGPLTARVRCHYVEIWKWLTMIHLSLSCSHIRCIQTELLRGGCRCNAWSGPVLNTSLSTRNLPSQSTNEMPFELRYNIMLL